MSETFGSCLQVTKRMDFTRREPVVDRVDVGAGDAVDPLDAFLAQGLGHRLARVHRWTLQLS